MEKYQKEYTVESLVELINRDPDLAFEEMQKMPGAEKEFYLGAMPLEAFRKMLARAVLENLEYSIKNKVETP